MRELLSKLDQHKSMGPDSIHPKLLVSLSRNSDFVCALTLLFRKCYERGNAPSIWKTANVSAIHKKGTTTEAKNYRPISLTCILSKIYEKLIRKHVLNHVTPLISKQQHGFMEGKSCLSNLLEFIDAINDLLANGECVDIFYMDFQKAFDTVPHYRLLSKLRGYGINGKTLAAISDFLSGRTFGVVVGDHCSSTYPVTSGIPQGSVLGPLLFLLYINDLPEGIQSSISLFADDVKMLAKAAGKDQTQQDIDSMCEWQDTWLLEFNTKDGKCKVLHVGKDNPSHNYYLKGLPLPVVKSERDLGVYVEQSLEWDVHIQKCIGKAKGVIAWVSRNVITRSPEVMVNLYKTVVRPHLEYCVQLWSPYPRHGNWEIIMAVEGVQRMYTRLIDGVGLLPYETRLSKLKLTTLLERRARGDLIETFRIVTGIANYGSNLFRKSPYGDNLIARTGTNDKRKCDFFSNRVLKYWNRLPYDVKSAKNVDTFKSRLGSFKDKNPGRSQQYWELSQEIFSRISDSDRNSYVTFMSSNPYIAKAKGINIK